MVTGWPRQLVIASDLGYHPAMGDDRPYNVDFNPKPPPGEFSGMDDVKFVLWGLACIIGLPLSVIVLFIGLLGAFK